MKRVVKYTHAVTLLTVYGDEGYDLYSGVHAASKIGDADVDQDEDNKHVIDQKVHR